MWQQFTGLFEGYGSLAMVVMLFGLLLCMIELIVPGFGVFGILGTIFTFGGIVVRCVLGVTILQIAYLIVFIVLLIVLALLLVVILAKIGVLSNSPIVQEKTVVPVDYEKPSKEFKKLVGKTGFATTVFKTSGKFVINGKIYEAISQGEYIEKDSKIKVVKIENNTIIVKKI